jgi:hypothetical protein
VRKILTALFIIFLSSNSFAGRFCNGSKANLASIEKEKVEEAKGLLKDFSIKENIVGYFIINPESLPSEYLPFMNSLRGIGGHLDGDIETMTDLYCSIITKH